MTIKRLIADFRPGRKGLGKVLGKLEASVMEVVWQRGRVSVREVYEALSQERRLAYTTVMTIMARLAEKKFLCKEKQGHAYYYTPALSRNEFDSSVVGEVIDGLLDDYGEAAFAHFLDRLSKEDASRLEKLEKLIRERQQRGD